MKTIFSEKDLSFIKENYNNMSYLEIGNILNFSERQIRGKVNNLGLTKIRNFDKNYFKEINSNNKAYWLGFIYADGYVIENIKNRNYELGIELNVVDTQHLNDFNNELGGVHNVTFKHSEKFFNGYEFETDSCLIRIYSKNIVKDLISLNVLQDKTNKKEFPICNDFYFWDFLRGFMDGDGCIHVNKNNYIILHFTNSNLYFLEYLKEKIEFFTKIDGSIYKEKDKKYRLYYNKQCDVKNILDKIYENNNSQLLTRKYNIYKSYYGSPI